MKEYIFPSKILLFGEYGIIYNYSGLLIPYYQYNGLLKFNNKNKRKNSKIRYTSNINIKKYANFLLKMILEISEIININKLLYDIGKGMYFHSTIPQKYGVGSSGALVAAIYYEYSYKHKQRTKYNIKILKNIFSKMESFFHVNSSGMDPLVCYMKQPILKLQNRISTLNIENNINKNTLQKGGIQKGGIFLIDSKISRKNCLMNKIFLKKIINIKDIFIINEKCIINFLYMKWHKLLNNVKQLSYLIINNMNFLIPKNILKIWKLGLCNNIFYMKLCGFGSGGYFLGFTSNYEKSKIYFKNIKTKIIFVF